jgi:hypothetical protein
MLIFIVVCAAAGARQCHSDSAATRREVETESASRLQVRQFAAEVVGTTVERAILRGHRSLYSGPRRDDDPGWECE